MNSNSNNSKPGVLFDFNPMLDVQTLNTLYASDYEQAQVVFETFFDEAKDYAGIMKQHYDSKELIPLKQFVHKIAHPFNYVGLPDLAERLEEFENQCKNVKEITELEDELQVLLQSMNTCMPIIEQESSRLKQFNA